MNKSTFIECNKNKYFMTDEHFSNFDLAFTASFRVLSKIYFAFYFQKSGAVFTCKNKLFSHF